MNRYFRKHCLICLTIGLLLSACGERGNENYKIMKFSTEDVAKSTFLPGRKFNYNKLLSPRRLMVLGDRLVVTDRNQNALIHILDPANNQHLRILGKAGEGPGEIGAGGLLLRGIEPSTFWSHFTNTKTLSLFSVNDTSKLAIKQVKQDENLFITTYVSWISDTSLMALRADYPEKFVEYNLKGQVLKTYGSWEEMIDQKVPISIISSLHQGKLTSSPDRKYFGFACVNRDMIEVLNHTNGKITSIRGPVNNINQFEVDNTPGYPMLSLGPGFKKYYADSFFGEEKIYALYSGEAASESGATTVFVFNYTGELIHSYKLEIPIGAITVDERINTIYGISTDESPNIVSFDLTNK